MSIQGISGTVKWTLDDKGTLLFEPVNGKEGTFADTKKWSTREWTCYGGSIKQIKSRGKINFAENSSCMFDNCFSLKTKHEL